MSCLNHICVRVERPAKLVGAQPLKLFSQAFELDSSVSLPYHSIIDVFRLLFGSDTVIVISSELVNYKNR